MSFRSIKEYLLALAAKKIITPLHQFMVSNRRVIILGKHLINELPLDETLKGLDVGCGKGDLAGYIENYHSMTIISGVDILVRNDAVIKVIQFNGKTLPFADKSFDFVMLIDVLHHTDNPVELLNECRRVAQRFILIKDHICESWWDKIRLRFMDWVGNRGHNVYLPYNYLSQKNWNSLYIASKLNSHSKVFWLGLYPWPFSNIFDAKLHFIEKLIPDEINVHQ